MPIFEYKCNKCGHVMEFLEKTSGSPKNVCQKCSSSDLQKIYSGFAVGQSKSARQKCQNCPSSPYQASLCSDSSCPFD